MRSRSLSYRTPQRYALRRTVQSALAELRKEIPDLQVNISELKTWQEIEPYTLILSAPSLVINEQLMCLGRFPKLEEALGWIHQASHQVLHEGG